MKYCTHCGKELTDEAVVCTGCGCAANGADSMKGAVKGVDISSPGLNILSFFIPLVGLILFCVMHGKTPRKAGQIGLSALIGFVINLIALIFLNV